MEYFNVYYSDKSLVQILASSAASAEEFARKARRNSSIESIKLTNSNSLNYLVKYVNNTATYVAAETKDDAIYFAKYIQPGISVSRAENVSNSINSGELESLEMVLEKLKEVSDELLFAECKISLYESDLKELNEEIKRLNNSSKKPETTNNQLINKLTALKSGANYSEFYSTLDKIEDEGLRSKVYQLFNLIQLDELEVLFLEDKNIAQPRGAKLTLLAILRTTNNRNENIFITYDKLNPALNILFSNEGSLNEKKAIILKMLKEKVINNNNG